jgi:hypothetical protein
MQGKSLSNVRGADESWSSFSDEMGLVRGGGGKTDPPREEGERESRQLINSQRQKSRPPRDNLHILCHRLVRPLTCVL